MSDIQAERSTGLLPIKKVSADDEDDQQILELPYGFQKELIEKLNRHWCGKHAFVPVGKHISQPIAAKFYSRHDQVSLDYEKFLQCTEPRHSKRMREGFPLLESQVYGWCWPGMPPKMRTDLNQLNFICAPKLRTGMTIHGEKVISERVTERPPFNGLRFIV